MNNLKPELYTSTDYKQILKTIVDSSKQSLSPITYDQLAKAMGVQKSYLSRLLKEPKVNLSGDQLYRGCIFLGIKEESELNHLQNLLHFAETQEERRKNGLLKLILAWQKKMAKTEAQLQQLDQINDPEKMRPFYSDPLHQIVHIFLTIPKFQKNSVARLSSTLGIPANNIAESIELLKSLNLVEQRADLWKAIQQRNHLPSDSPLFQSWRSQLRSLSQTRLHYSPKDQTYSFSVVFSATDEVRKKIHQKFLHLLKEIQPEVEIAPAENCYLMNFDLFPWV